MARITRLEATSITVAVTTIRGPTTTTRVEATTTRVETATTRVARAMAATDLFRRNLIVLRYGAPFRAE